MPIAIHPVLKPFSSGQLSPYGTRSVPWRKAGVTTGTVVALLATLLAAPESRGGDLRQSLARVRPIEVEVLSSGHPALDRSAKNLLSLDLLSRGYSYGAGHDLGVRSPGDRTELPGAGTVRVVCRTLWDSVLVWKSLQEDRSDVAGVLLARVQTYLAALAPSGDTLLSAGSTDTARVFKVGPELYLEPAKYLLQRAIGACTEDIPLCEVEGGDQLPRRMVPVLFCVDDLYRTAFPQNWKQRLLLRLQIVNDILSPQLPVQFVAASFRHWDSTGLKPLEFKLLELKEFSPRPKDSLVVGITFNETLRSWKRPRKVLGLADVFGQYLVVSGLPSLPGLQAWNALDEATILAHEIGHILGAPHVSEPQSLMFEEFPGEFAYQMDASGRALAAASAWFAINSRPRHMAEAYVRTADSLYLHTRGSTPPVLAELLQCLVIIGESGPRKWNTINDMERFIRGQIRSRALKEALLGRIAYSGGRYARALVHFERALKERPGIPDVVNYMRACQGSTEADDPSPHEK